MGKLTVKEHFVYTDAEGILYHFLVEGNVFTDASKIPPEVRRPYSVKFILCVLFYQNIHFKNL